MDLPLKWEASPDGAVVGYRVYYGTVPSLVQGKTVDIAGTSATIHDLAPGETYYVGVTAFDEEGMESYLSNVIAYDVPGVVPLIISAVEDRPVIVNLAAGLSNLLGATFSTLSSPSHGVLSGVGPLLTYTPAKDFFGSDRFTYSVDSLFGTISGTVNINVAPVNDPPTFDPIPTTIVIPQNAGLRSIPLTGISSGPDNEPQWIEFSAISTNPALFSAIDFDYESPNPGGFLQITPNPNSWGAGTISVVASDGESTVSRTFMVVISNPPTLNPLSDLTLSEDAGAQNIILSGISAGAANEVSQPVKITVTSSNPALIPTPTVHYINGLASGTMTFKPVPNVAGTAKITVTVNDGQTANNTVSRSFTVRVNAINDAPTLNAISSLIVEQSSGMRTVSLTGIGSGAANENQTLVVTATSSRTSLIPKPTVTYTSPSLAGRLSFKPVANQTGVATITVTVNDGQNLCTRTFNVTVGSGGPVISNLARISDDARSVTMGWNTDQSATCVLEYGLTPTPSLVSAQTSGTAHTMTLTNLLPGATYYLTVRATSPSGSTTQTATVATPAAGGILFSAEDGQLTAPMAAWTNATAENRGYIASPVAGSGKAVFNLNVARGLNDRMWARVKTPAGGATFYVSVDGGAEKLLFASDNGATNQWHWALLADGSKINAATVPIDAGLRRLSIRANTASVLLDEFAISNDPLWRPILPTAKPILNAVRTDVDAVELSWSDASGNAANVGLESSTDGMSFQLFYVLNSSETSLRVGSLTPGAINYFRVFSYNSVDRTAYSDIIVVGP